MSENLESNSPEGSTESPNSDTSQGQNVSSTSKSPASQPPEQLESLVSKAVEKALQSQKDKRISSIEKTLDGFKPVLEQVKNILTPEQLKEFNQIQKDAEFEEMKRMVYGQAQTGTQQIGNPKSTADEVQSIFAEYSVSPNDPEAIPLLELQGADLIKGVSKLALKRAKQSPPDSSEAGALQGSPAKSSGTEEAIAKLSALQKEPTKNRAEIAALKKSLGW